MSFKSVDHIITSKHLSRTGKAKDWIGQCLKDIQKARGVAVPVPHEEVKGSPVIARVYRGHWVADCDVCNGAMFVDPEYPFFFCCECFNRTNNGHLRAVQFPPEDERLEIERLLLERPINDVAGITDSDRAGRATAILYKELPDGSSVGMLREWMPSETIADLKEQNKLVDRWKSDTKNGTAREGK